MKLISHWLDVILCTRVLVWQNSCWWSFFTPAKVKGEGLMCPNQSHTNCPWRRCFTVWLMSIDPWGIHEDPVSLCTPYRIWSSFTICVEWHPPLIIFLHSAYSLHLPGPGRTSVCLDTCHATMVSSHHVAHVPLLPLIRVLSKGLPYFEQLVRQIANCLWN